MRLGDKLLTEKTRVAITITNFFLLIGALVSGVAFLVDWKTDTEYAIKNNTERIMKVEEKLGSIDNVHIELAEIKTDLKWIRAALEDKE